MPMFSTIQRKLSEHFTKPAIPSVQHCKGSAILCIAMITDLARVMVSLWLPENDPRSLGS